MKNRRENDYWTYQNQNGHIAIVYCIDGKRMGKYSAIQYLIDHCQMSQEAAVHYIENQVSHI